MDAKQTKALIKVARKALALLDPDWTVAVELKAALEQASVPVQATRKATGKVNQHTAWMRQASAEMDAWRASGESVSDFHKRVTARFLAGKASANIVKSGKGFNKKAVAERLEVCACGHKAGDHEKDELENLLKCTAHIEAIDQDCTCDHFHYETVTRQAA